MTTEALTYMNSELDTLGVPYQFSEWTSDIVYPFWVGEYTETEPMNEDGEQDSTFILTGTTNGTLTDLQSVADTLRSHFGYAGLSCILDSGRGIAVSYAGCTPIPSADEGIKRMQVNLRIQEWGTE